MNRRKFLKASAMAATAAMLLPQVTLATPAPMGRRLTISDILSVSFPAIVADMQQNDELWDDPLFATMRREGRFQLATLGVMIQRWGSKQTADIEQLCCPIVWSEADEAMQRTEKDKIEYVRVLSMNAIQAMDDMLVERLEERYSASTRKQVVCAVSKEFHHSLGSVEQIPNMHAYIAKAWMAFGVLD